MAKASSGGKSSSDLTKEEIEGTTVNSEFFARILFSRIALKDISAT